MARSTSGPVLHFPDDHTWHGRGIVVAVAACRPVRDRRVRDDDEHNCHGQTWAVTCKRCRRSARFVAAQVREARELADAVDPWGAPVSARQIHVKTSDPRDPDRQLHQAILNWAILRYGPRLVERGELPAGVWDRQHAWREARAAEGEARRHYEKIANGGRT